MPPKDKAAQQKREKIAEDKTFGMKNKNKSKSVQKYIKSISANAGASKSSKEIDAEHKAKKDKEANMQNKALMASLFNQQTDKKGREYDPVAKKAAKQAAEEALAAGKSLKDEVRKAIIEGIANSIRLTDPKGVRMSELGGHAIIHALKDKYADTFKTLSLLLFIKANKEVFWVDDEESSNPTIRCKDDVDAEVAPDERPIEEILEEKRRNLPPGGTPVTLETFLSWKQKKDNEKREQKDEDIKAAQAKDKGNKHAGLSGKDLFTFDASLFVDDADAAEAEELDERSSNASSDEAPKAEVEGEEDAEEEAPKAEETKPSGDVAAVGDAKLFLEGGDDLPDDLDDLDD